MCGYFDLLRGPSPDGELVVMLDTYSAHRAEEINNYAKALNVTLLFLPPGCTDQLQPFDRRIFGIAQVHACRMWREHYQDSKGKKEPRDRMGCTDL
jgi:hypothetical protein